MNHKQNPFEGMHAFILLWLTQSLSTLGSSMTSFALIVWSYEQKGSALTTALLSICSYAPYVVLSMFAGALSDRWNKKYTMLVCDSFAALCTVFILILLKCHRLEIWHLYAVNALNGIMNTVQQPASEVAVSLLTPENQYQKAGGMRAFSNSLVTILTPVIATAVFSLAGLQTVIFIDLATFVIAFVTLAGFIKLPHMVPAVHEKAESLLQSAGAGLRYLRDNRGILDIILFLAAINLTASMYNSALPAMVLSRPGGSKTALGLVNMCTGLANLAGSILVSMCPAPKSRVKAICGSLLFSMSTENLILAFGRSTPVWCFGVILGWLCIPVMNTNLDVVLRTYIPVELQGRVYSARNTLQFFTIPVGYLLGGWLVDRVLEPLMAAQGEGSFLIRLFGTGKGSGAACLFFLLWIIGIATCLVFMGDKHMKELEK